MNYHVPTEIVFSNQINCCFASKWAWSLEGEAFLADGVGEGDDLGVEHEACVGVSVKHVAHDGAAQSALVAGVYTQLMRAACEWVERYTCAVVGCVAQHLVACDGAFAVIVVYHLARTVVDVGA